jgi:glycerophosphoryl diester phosphodiesterase
MVTPAQSEDRAPPFLVAHRAGNDLVLLERARRLPVRFVEADVHLYAGRLEIRHLKTVGPLPILWDRWELASPWTPRLLVDRLLGATATGPELILDLKGRDRRLPARLARELARHAPGRPLTICSRSWPLLEPLLGLPGVRVVHSVGSRRQLEALIDPPAPSPLEGVSIHRRLLTPAVVADLRRRAGLIMTWPIATAHDARRLAGWGVDGVITERWEALAPELLGESANAIAGMTG